MCPLHVCVPDQSDVADMLDSHDPDKNGGLVPPPEVDSCLHLAFQSCSRHIRSMPAVSWNSFSVSFCRLIDHSFYRLEIRIRTGSNHSAFPLDGIQWFCIVVSSASPFSASPPPPPHLRTIYGYESPIHSARRIEIPPNCAEPRGRCCARTFEVAVGNREHLRKVGERE